MVFPPNLRLKNSGRLFPPAAYWQIRTLPNIPYDVDKLKAYLVGSTGTITLIRNFAKVTMKNSAANFELISFKVFNTPNKGYIAPYISSGSNSGFVSNYDALEYYNDK